MTNASAIYEGTIVHRRANPPYGFRHPLALWFVDLDELPGILGGRLLGGRWSTVRFRREDYCGDPAVPLDVAVRDAVQDAAGWRPTGPVRMLTQLRSFGHCFNPVTFYYCLDRDGGSIEALLAEVTNTPWAERHSYVLAQRPACAVPRSGVLRGTFAKALHVSPFMDMDQVYECHATLPGAALGVAIESRKAGKSVFRATLAMRRIELTRRSVARITLRYPLASVRVLALIYSHALGLRLAGARVFPHPARESA